MFLHLSPFLFTGGVHPLGRHPSTDTSRQTPPPPGKHPPEMATAAVSIPVADPGFPRGGGANSPGGHQHTILQKFPKNCMKLKEFGPSGGGAHPQFYYVDPPLHPTGMHSSL